MNSKDLEQIVRRVIAELGVQQNAAADKPAAPAGPAVPSAAVAVEDDMIPDIRSIDYRKIFEVPNAANREEFLRIKGRTWARLGLGRSGPRYKTQALLRFWADNAAAMDAVFTDVPQEFLDQMGLFGVQTKCTSKDEFLTRPDLGTQFDDAAIAEIKQRCQASPEVQVYVADGLSSTAVEANVPELLPALEQGLKLHGKTMGTPFFVKYGRVRSMEPIAEALGATVICVLLGERPGLASAESLSAYLAYKPTIGMSEADRTCVSNIHVDGTNPIEAGAHIADVINEMFKQQASGINLKL